MGRVAVDKSKASSSTGMVSPTRAALDEEVFASKTVWPSLMKRRVFSSMEIVKWRCIVRYRTENRLVDKGDI
jgi:hypothetical protein